MSAPAAAPAVADSGAAAAPAAAASPNTDAKHAAAAGTTPNASNASASAASAPASASAASAASATSSAASSSSSSSPPAAKQWKVAEVPEGADPLDYINMEKLKEDNKNMPTTKEGIAAMLNEMPITADVIPGLAHSLTAPTGWPLPAAAGSAAAPLLRCDHCNQQVRDAR